ncbi:hypothetical protein OUZ56_012313 [Daphnia magna]|uniref:Uncharacterized protein n=1 Tax=Daphnia magna TaxID=35525 RepID=A0ABQ9Z2S0_9CRUS|nr:hypothetical protein OUZ56_012313 [Daphnia magna]
MRQDPDREIWPSFRADFRKSYSSYELARKTLSSAVQALSLYQKERIEMEELYAALVYRDQLDFEIVPANQVPQSLLESPGRCGYIPKRLCCSDNNKRKDHVDVFSRLRTRGNKENFYEY